MMKNFFKYTGFILFFFATLLGYADENAENPLPNPVVNETNNTVLSWPTLHFYTGFGFGYGDTNWSQLVNHTNNPIVQISAPDGATSGGLTYEFFLGYKPVNYFALEARFTHYPQAVVHLAHVYENEINPLLPHVLINSPYGLYDLSTNTNTYAILAKFFVPITQDYRLSIYADFGPNYTQRTDVLAGDTGVWNPTFGAGVEWRFAPRFKTDFEFEYAAGHGEASEFPVKQYIPFVFNVELRLAYMFNL